jgi:hypothetical protein
MLSFMREQETANTSDHSPAGTGPRNSEPQEFLTVAANRKSLRRSTIVVSILVAVGLICLMMMIRKSQPQAASARQAREDEQKIEAAISRLTGARSEIVDRMDEIVQKFYEYSDVFQVKVGELVKNPFETEGYMKGLRRETVVADDSHGRAELARRQRMQQQAGTLQLLSIMRSEAGHSCMINDRILREGQTIEGFTISQIGSHFVELVWSPEGAVRENASETEELKTILKLSE